MRLQPVLVLPRPRLSGIAVDARQDRTFSNAKFAAQLPETESASFLPVLSGQIVDALPLSPLWGGALLGRLSMRVEAPYFYRACAIGDVGIG